MFDDLFDTIKGFYVKHNVERHSLLVCLSFTFVPWSCVPPRLGFGLVSLVFDSCFVARFLLPEFWGDIILISLQPTIRNTLLNG